MNWYPSDILYKGILRKLVEKLWLAEKKEIINNKRSPGIIKHHWDPNVKYGDKIFMENPTPKNKYTTKTVRKYSGEIFKLDVKKTNVKVKKKNNEQTYESLIPLEKGKKIIELSSDSGFSYKSYNSSNIYVYKLKNVTNNYWSANNVKKRFYTFAPNALIADKYCSNEG
ncbi:hypothetical protein SNEBB_001845, partial [Seison nebaliae]